MNKNNNIFYYKRGDLWVLKTHEEPTHPYASVGEVIFIGDRRPMEEQVDDLLDLILMKDKYYPYYVEILTRLMEMD